MRQIGLASVVAIALLAPPSFAQQATSNGPYQVLKTSRVGGEGGFDYIYADAAGGRLYIPRGGSRAVPATDSTPAKAAVPGRITVWDLRSLAPVGEIPNTGGQGVAVDPKSGHGFSSSRPVTMFDTKTLNLLKTIDVAPAAPDGILFDAYNERVYIFSHPTRNATVIDARDGTVVGTVDLGGVPEEAVSDGRGTLYVVMQDAAGSVAVVDVNTMKTTAHYPFGDVGRCNGLALDAEHHVLFAACASSGNPPAEPAQPMMVIMSSVDGKIIAKLPLPGASDGAVFNPATQEAFATLGNGLLAVVKENSPTSFEMEQTLPTMLGARTITLDRGTNHILTMSFERGPAPAAPPAGAQGGRGGRGYPPMGAPIPGSFTILVIGKP